MKPPVVAALLASSAFLLTTPVHAQGIYWAWAFEPSVPIGPVRNAVSNASPAGASFGVRYLFEKSWSLGIGGHWAEFAQNYPRTTYPIENGAITGAAYRRVWTTSLLADARREPLAKPGRLPAGRGTSAARTIRRPLLGPDVLGARMAAGVGQAGRRRGGARVYREPRGGPPLRFRSRLVRARSKCHAIGHHRGPLHLQHGRISGREQHGLRRAHAGNVGLLSRILVSASAAGALSNERCQREREASVRPIAVESLPVDEERRRAVHSAAHARPEVAAHFLQVGATFDVGDEAVDVETEIFGVSEGLWSYPAPDFLGIPFWSATMWISVGLLGRRFLIPATEWLAERMAGQRAYR